MAVDQRQESCLSHPSGGFFAVALHVLKIFSKEQKTLRLDPRQEGECCLHRDGAEHDTDGNLGPRPPHSLPGPSLAAGALGSPRRTLAASQGGEVGGCCKPSREAPRLVASHLARGLLSWEVS